MAESSSIQTKADRPVIVRVKRKASQSRLDAFWLEINERPLKRPLLDFGKLSISDSASTAATCPHAVAEELKSTDASSSTKVLVRHVETVTTSEETFDVLRSVVPNSDDASKVKEKNAGRMVRTANKQSELLTKAKQSQEVLARNARFEQIWRSRKGKKEEDSIYEMCRLYDVVQIDEAECKVPDKGMDLEDCQMMARYLPLLREVLPTAAEEVESDIHDSMSKQVSLDGYVYDFYRVEEATAMESESASQFPLVQVDDDSDYYDGPDDSEYESDDSNAENNPLNDYPDEEISKDEDEVTSQSEEEKSEDESGTSEDQSEALEIDNTESYEDSGPRYWSDNGDQFFGDEMYSDGDDYVYDDDFGDDEWR